MLTTVAVPHSGCLCVQVARIFKSLSEERDNVRVVALPDVGHCPHDDRPEIAAGHILPWLDNLHSTDESGDDQ